MNYDAELRFLCDTFHRLGVQTVVAELNRPVSTRFAAGLPPLLPEADDKGKPLAAYLPNIRPATVYHLSGWMQCCYTFFILPELQPDAVLFIGPYLTVPVTKEKIMEQAELYRMDTREHKRIQRYYTALPILPKNSQIHRMTEAFFDRAWGRGNYTVESIHPNRAYDAPPFWPDLRLSEAENTLVDMAIMEERYAQENNLMDAIRQGHLWQIESIMSQISPGVLEMRLPDPVRNLKNYGIIINTLFRKAAEQGGVHPVYIDSLSASFATKIEQIPTLAAGNQLFEEMAREYCRLVRNNTTKGFSAPVQKAIVIIDSDLSADLRLSGLARQVNLNSSYLSALFKKETGFTVTDYIANRRIRFAQYLLESTKLQIQTIGQFCGLEDAHYFSKVFKKLTGQTPMQYRHDVLTK